MPIFRTLSGITRTSASNTPSRPIQPPQSVSRTPSPGPWPTGKPPLQPSGHRRQGSDASASVLSDTAAPARTDSVRTAAMPGELSERLSWGSEDARQGSGAASLASTQFKVRAQHSDLRSIPSCQRCSVTESRASRVCRTFSV